MTDDASSQTLKAVLGLRGLILEGELRPGTRVSEPLLVERFGVSRTPARTALVRMNEEGLLEQLPSGGFAVKGFTEQDLADAIEIRGTLEGMAARFAAERGAPSELLTRMDRCVSDLDRAVAALSIHFDLDDFVRFNDEFHALLVEASGSEMIAHSLQRVMSLPFAAPNAFIESQRADVQGVVQILVNAQDQHRTIVEAIRNRQGARAQALTIEHSFAATRYLRLVLASGEPSRRIAALTLIKASRFR
ncbi:GntR family transcriptional regulator [Bradyrhizobium commune]|uniref:GntR family transcriptional regulator n=1 Tax=Bradyrhizobium commune TaxID=83627 RepID=A0A7S9GYK6_9BRAD|nr:GntR family transcriptional regulator [Bradyrhizobium commune]QPF90689.1 GntR family transcriptional regulator [Bradyrhizobium commune]